MPSPIAKKPKTTPPGTKLDKKTACTNPASRRKPSTNSLQEGEDEEACAGNDAGANHNKYCHFCQHVKVRASSMLACENAECSRRFCEHCLLTHLGEDVDPMSSDAWAMVNGKACWNCPICRSKCCCSVTECSATHRHCKAYRYRRRRAELALKRIAAMTDKHKGKRTVTPKRPGAPSASRPMLIETSLGAADYCDVETPPASAAWSDDKVKQPWAEEEEARKDAPASPVDSIVGSPSRPTDTARAEEERLQDQLLRGVWSHDACDGEGSSHDTILLHLHSDNEESEVKAAHRVKAVLNAASQHAHVQDCDDMMAGVLGHMAEEEVGDLEDMGAHDEHLNVSSLAWPSQVQHDVTTLDALLDEAEMRAHQRSEEHGDKEVDEVEWLRRTYETVYNPAARQRALDQLVCSGSPAKRPMSAASKPLPARPVKSTVLYDYV